MKRSVTFYNLGFLIAALVGANWNTNLSFDQLLTQNKLAQTEVVTYNGQANFDEEKYSKGLEDLGISLHPGTSYTSDSVSSPSSLKHCESLVYRTLKSLPVESVSRLKNLTLYFSDEGRRGLGGGTTVILRCQNVTDEELVSVLVHEMGHITDTGVLVGSESAAASSYMDGSNNVKADDESLDFYNISFENESTVREDATELDFVSGYAMTDPYEDFAESYDYYVLHGNDFRELAQYNAALQQKYDFLKNNVFKGYEYGDEEVSKADIFARKYDVTVLPYDMEEFFVI
jgi:hypothetical protein